MDVLLGHGTSIEVFTTGIDVGDDLVIILSFYNNAAATSSLAVTMPPLIDRRDSEESPCKRLHRPGELPDPSSGRSVPTNHVKDNPWIGSGLLRPEEQAIDLVLLRHFTFEVGVHHLVGMGGDRNAAWETGGSRADLF